MVPTSLRVLLRPRGHSRVVALPLSYPEPPSSASDEAPKTLCAKLAAGMRSPDGLRGSLQQLADRYATPSQRSNVRRALRDIRRTNGPLYHETQRWDGRTQLSPIRRLFREPPPWGPSADLSLNPLISETGEVKTTGRSDHPPRARADSATRVRPPQRPERVRARPFPTAPALLRGRSPAREQSSGGDGVRLDPSPELRAELLTRFGAGWTALLLAELRTERCGAPLVDVDRALRTTLLRDTPDGPLRTFRGLLRLARGGSVLCDRAAEAERMVAAESAARAAYAWDPKTELPLPTPAELYQAEYGGQVYGQLVDVGGGFRAVVQPQRAPPRDPMAELQARLDALDLRALDEDRPERVAPAAAPPLDGIRSE